MRKSTTAVELPTFDYGMTVGDITLLPRHSPCVTERGSAEGSRSGTDSTNGRQRLPQLYQWL